MSNRRKTDSGLRIRADASKRPFPDFSKPIPIGYFSVNTEREYDRTAKKLSYFRQPSPDMFPLDLKIGLDKAIKKPIRDMGIDLLLKYIFDHKNELMRSQQDSFDLPALGADFICYRGLLKLIMCTPYEHQNDWCILATSFKNSIYLCKRDTEQDIKKRDMETPKEKAVAAWGFKFEQYCLTETPSSVPNIEIPVDECSEFNCVFKTNLNGMDLLYSAEVDGIESNEVVNLDENPRLIDQLKFIELKTCPDTNKHWQKQAYLRYRTRNWWCQSFLVGIEDLYKGVKNETGFITHIEHIEVRSLPKVAKNHWDPSVCANFLVRFLRFVLRVLRNINDPYTTFEFYFDSSKPSIDYEIRIGKTDYSFLPDWYIQSFKCQDNNKK